MKVKILEFSKGSFAIIPIGKEMVNKNVNIKKSTLIQIDKSDPIKVIEQDVPNWVIMGEYTCKKKNDIYEFEYVKKEKE